MQYLNLLPSWFCSTSLERREWRLYLRGTPIQRRTAAIIGPFPCQIQSEKLGVPLANSPKWWGGLGRRILPAGRRGVRSRRQTEQIVGLHRLRCCAPEKVANPHISQLGRRSCRWNWIVDARFAGCVAQIFGRRGSAALPTTWKRLSPR